MAIAGAGAGINELTALAATSEMAPTRKRGVYVSALIFTIVPFCPSVLWAQLIAYYSNWRYVGAFCGAWSAFGLLITILFYFPPPRVNSAGLSKKEIIGRIDFVGGFLSITGLIIFLAGLQWGGYMVCLAISSSGTSTLLTLCPVSLGLCSCPGTPDHWVPSSGGLWFLGDIWSQVSHLSVSPEARTSDTGPYTCDYLYLRCQLLLRPDVLAHTSIQRLRS
jgi:hypothetical protein